MKYCGIDIGLDGGIVVINNGKVIFNSIMPVVNSTKSRKQYDIARIVDILREQNPDFTYVEKPLLHPKSGKMSYQKSGFGFGIFQGILSALDLRYDIISPKRWQKNIFAGMNRKDTKQASILFAKRMAPKIDWRKSKRSEKYHDGKTDAFCIAEYCKRLNS